MWTHILKDRYFETIISKNTSTKKTHQNSHTPKDTSSKRYPDKLNHTNKYGKPELDTIHTMINQRWCGQCIHYHTTLHYTTLQRKDCEGEGKQSEKNHAPTVHTYTRSINSHVQMWNSSNLSQQACCTNSLLTVNTLLHVKLNSENQAFGQSSSANPGSIILVNPWKFATHIEIINKIGVTNLSTKYNTHTHTHMHTHARTLGAWTHMCTLVQLDTQSCDWGHSSWSYSVEGNIPENLHWPVAPVPVAGSDGHEARAPVVAESACASQDHCWQWKRSLKCFGVLVVVPVAGRSKEQSHLSHSCNKTTHSQVDIFT